MTCMRAMFSNCFSLSSFRDLYKWDTSNVTEMDYMFYSCMSLTNLSFISKWNTSKVKNKYNIFYGCISLSFIPKISDGKFEYFELSECPNCLNRPKVKLYNLIYDENGHILF